MNYIHSIQSWSPRFRGAFKALALQQSTYTSEDDRRLERTREAGEWVPHKHVIQYVPNLPEVEVVMITRETSIKDLGKSIEEEGEAGLVLMGPSIDRFSMPHLIILTTQWKYVVIDPKDRMIGLKFLKVLLRTPGFKIFMSNLYNEADCLHHQLGIVLSDSKTYKAEIICCTGTHVHMMQFMRHMDEACTYKYPASAGQKSRERFAKFEKFHDLVEYWLDVHMKHIEFDPEQLIQLTIRPLSVTAKNVIKKRCCLVVSLNKVLEHFSQIEFEFSSELVYNVFSLCNANVAKDLRDELPPSTMEEYSYSLESGASCSLSSSDEPLSKMETWLYYANLSSGITTDKYKIIPEIVEYETEDECDDESPYDPFVLPQLGPN